MSNNSSSASNSSLSLTEINCFLFSGAAFIIYSIIRYTIVSPCIFYVLYVGHQRWRQQGSFAALSHADIITFHMVGFELVWFLSVIFFYCGTNLNVQELIILRIFMSTVTYCGQHYCHVLTCLERYLAVVYPIIYMRIRKTPGVMIRNVSIACVWLFSLLWSWLVFLPNRGLHIFIVVSSLVPSTTVILFCSFSILRVLNRPGPGARVQEKEQGDQSKEKAYLTVVGIMVVEALWFVNFLFTFLIDFIISEQTSVICTVKIITYLFNLPSSLVLPLLYLHREGKLSCRCPNSG